MFDLLRCGFFTPNAVALKAESGEGRSLEADQFGHFHGERWRGVYDPGNQVRVGEGSAIASMFNVPISIGVIRRLGLAVGDTGKANGVALFHRGGLEPPVVGRTTDDDAPYPFQNLLLFSTWSCIEIVRQVPCQPAPFR